MNIMMNKINIKNCAVICILCIYFTTKMLWDSIPYFFELISIAIITWGALKCFLKRNDKNRIILLYRAFCLYIVLSGLYNDDFRQIARAMYEYIFYSLIFWAAVYYGRKASIKQYGGFLTNVGMIVGILSWIEYLTHHYILPNTHISYKYSYLFRSIVFSRTFLTHGVVLGFFMILCMYLYFTDQKKIMFLKALFLFSAILTTGSRGPLAASVIGILIMFTFLELSKKRMSTKKIFIILFILILILSVHIIMTSSFLTGNQIIDYFIARIRSITDWKDDAGNLGRLGIWKRSYKLFKDNIWFGIGPSQTGSWDISGKYGVTESGLLKHLCELGIIGSILYYAFLLYVFFDRKNKKKIDNEYYFYFAVFISIFIHDLTMQSTEEIIVSYLMWYSLAQIYNLTKKGIKRNTNNGINNLHIQR